MPKESQKKTKSGKSTKQKRNIKFVTVKSQFCADPAYDLIDKSAMQMAKENVRSAIGKGAKFKITELELGDYDDGAYYDYKVQMSKRSAEKFKRVEQLEDEDIMDD